MFEKEKKEEKDETKEKIEKLKKSQPQKVEIPGAVSQEIDEIMRRLRLLEERYSGLRKKTQFTEQNMLRDAKDITDELNVINTTLTEIKSEMSELNEKVMKLVEEVKTSVKKPDFNVLVKYLEYWEPLNFLTRKEADNLIEEYKQKLIIKKL